ncbi:DUF2799 domain-containing protein [bacterium]|nr:DUF2799 domain-containing protein [bacterium]
MSVKFFRIFNILLFLMLSGCTSSLVQLKPTCSELNWFERGRQDGMQGQPSNNWMMKSEECELMTKDEIQNYMDGWNHGLSMYCTEEHGFATAKAGIAYKKTCPEKYEENFLKGYQEGLNVFMIEKETSLLIAHIESEEVKLKKTPQGTKDYSEIEKNLASLNQKKLANLKTLEKYNHPIAR